MPRRLRRRRESLRVEVLRLNMSRMIRDSQPERYEMIVRQQEREDERRNRKYQQRYSNSIDVRNARAERRSRRRYVNPHDAARARLDNGDYLEGTTEFIMGPRSRSRRVPSLASEVRENIITLTFRRIWNEFARKFLFFV